MPFSEARVSPADIGLLRGYGVFEVLRTYNGKPFLFDDHMNRLRRSAEKMNISVPYSCDEIRETINRLMKKNEVSEAYIRVLITGGETGGGILYDPQIPTFIILTEDPDKIDEKYYKEGAHLVTVEHERVFPDIKTTNYAVAVKNLPLIREKGALDILYTLKGKVMESSTSSFFIVKKGTLVTPKDGVLPGITRKFVLEMAKGVFPVEERDILLPELKEASEAFITATNKEIVPVVKVDDTVIGSGTVGETTTSLMSLFREKVKKMIS